MNQLLEILGRAITIDTAELIWHWFDVAVGTEHEQGAVSEELRKIVQLAIDGKLEKAHEQLKFYLFENQSCPEGRLTAAAICIQQNKIKDAIEQLNSVYMQQPSNTMALYALGHCYERLGNEAEAIAFYQDCLKFKNYLKLPRQRIAAIYFKNGQIEKAIKEYEQLKNEYPDDMSILVALGYLYIANGKYKPAAKEFDSAILMHPDNYYNEDEALNQMVQEGRFHEVMDELNEQIEAQPERGDLLIKRADVLAMLGDNEEAICQYEKVLDICPDSLETTIKLGTLYLQLHHENLAAKQFNRAVEINDRIVDAYIGLATAQKMDGQLSKAAFTLSMAAAIQGNSSMIFTETTILQFKINMQKTQRFYDKTKSVDLIETVIKTHKKQIELQPQNPDTYYRMGILMMYVERTREAVKLFSKVLEINPMYSRALSKLTICLFETGQKDKALAKLNESNCPDKNTLELHYKTALLYCNKIKFASSLMNLEKFLKENFASLDAIVNISVILQNLGLLSRESQMWDSICDAANNAVDTNG